jgi:hypothetical protein
MKRKMVYEEDARAHQYAEEKARKPEYAQQQERWLRSEYNRRFKKKFDRVVESKKAAPADLDDMQKELESNRSMNVRMRGGEDPRYAAWMEDFYKQLHLALEGKILEILRIEPTINIKAGTKVKVAVVEIADDVRTIRYGERERWRRFFRTAGFETEAVFLPAFVVGYDVSADAIRTAAARLGAGAVLAYTTTTETETSPGGESAAVLAFAKCMFLDTRTEYLYFNAEGEGKEKKITLPGFLDVEGFENEVVEKAVEGLRSEILHELERLRAE